MSDEPQLAAIRGLLHKVRTAIRGPAHRGTVEISTPDAFTLSLLWRSVRTFDGVIALLERHLPEEALILGRALFSDSLRLAELESAGSDRVPLLLGWLKKSLTEKQHLLREAIASGLDPDAHTTIVILQEQESQLQGYMRRHGIRRLRNFLQERAAADKFGRRNDFWTYSLAHEMVHGSDAAFIYSRRKTGVQSVLIDDRTRDPGVTIGVGLFCMRSALQAGTATCGIFGWSEEAELLSLACELHEFERNYAAPE